MRGAVYRPKIIMCSILTIGKQVVFMPQVDLLTYNSNERVPPIGSEKEKNTSVVRTSSGFGCHLLYASNNTDIFVSVSVSNCYTIENLVYRTK